jgi:hypothetical protein
MVRLMSCHVRECRQEIIDRQRDKRPSTNEKEGRREGRNNI